MFSMRVPLILNGQRVKIGNNEFYQTHALF